MPRHRPSAAGSTAAGCRLHHHLIHRDGCEPSLVPAPAVQNGGASGAVIGGLWVAGDRFGRGTLPRSSMSRSGSLLSRSFQVVPFVAEIRTVTLGLWISQ